MKSCEVWLGVQIGLLAAIGLQDLQTRTIPNSTLAAAALCGLPQLWHVGWASTLAGAGAGLISFLALYSIQGGAMGEADVKLAAVIGLYTGWPAVVNALALGIVLGGLWAAAWLLLRRQREFPYAPALALGAISVLLTDEVRLYETLLALG